MPFQGESLTRRITEGVARALPSAPGGDMKMSKLQGPLRGRSADFSLLERPPVEGVDILLRARPSSALDAHHHPAREDVEAD